MTGDDRCQVGKDNPGCEELARHEREPRRVPRPLRHYCLDGVRRTSVILIDRREAEKLTGDVFGLDDSVDAGALPVRF